MLALLSESYLAAVSAANANKVIMLPEIKNLTERRFLIASISTIEMNKYRAAPRELNNIGGTTADKNSKAAVNIFPGVSLGLN